jgi:cytochrome P450
MTLSAVDLLSGDFARIPHPYYARLRRTCPVWWDEATRSWYITAYRDVNALLRDPRLTARIGSGFLGDHDRQAVEGVRDILSFFDSWPMFSDGSPHAAMRAAAAPAYRLSMIRPLRNSIAARARDLLSRLDPDAADLLGDYAQPLATSVTCDLLGVPAARQAEVLGWSAEVIGFIGVPQLDLERVAAAREAIAGLRDHLERVTLPDARDGKGPAPLRAFLQLEPDHALALFTQILTGGIEPIVASLGSALTHLLGDARFLLDQACRGEVEVERLAEEALRFEAPFHFVPRTAAHPVTLHGHTLEPGQRVALVVASANRDEDAYAAPGQFRLVAPDQAGPPHLAFGAGSHFCLGAGLARITLTEALRAVAQWASDRHIGQVRADRVPAFGHTVWRRIGLGY